MTPAQLEALRQDLGLDGPPYVRYARWLGLQPLIAAFTGEKAVPGVLQGNFGYTLSARRAVVEEIAPRIGPTLLLMGTSLCSRRRWSGSRSGSSRPSSSTASSTTS